jgi:hypothetical protein
VQDDRLRRQQRRELPRSFGEGTAGGELAVLGDGLVPAFTQARLVVVERGGDEAVSGVRQRRPFIDEVDDDRVVDGGEGSGDALVVVLEDHPPLNVRVESHVAWVERGGWRDDALDPGAREVVLRLGQWSGSQVARVSGHTGSDEGVLHVRAVRIRFFRPIPCRSRM